MHLESPHSDVLLKIHELLDSAPAFKQLFATLEDRFGLGLPDDHFDSSFFGEPFPGFAFPLEAPV